MRILSMLCMPFSQQSAVTEPLALPDLTGLKPLPCPVPWLTSPCMWAPLPYPLALPPLPCQALLLCPVLRPKPASTGQASILYPVPRPYYPSQVGPSIPLPPTPGLALPALTGASPLFNDKDLSSPFVHLSLTFLFPLLLPKARLATPQIIPPLKNNILFCTAFL